MNPFGDPRKLMKQLQQAQERVQQEIAALRIDPEVVSKDDVEMLQDLVLAAVNDAARKVDRAVQEKIGALTGGLKIPGLG